MVSGRSLAFLPSEPRNRPPRPSRSNLLGHLGDRSMVDPLSQITLAKVAHYVYQYGPKIYALLRKEKDRLAAIEAKIDQITIREIQSSFQIIDGLAAVSSEAMRDRHLTQAESNLLKNIGLDPDEKLGGRPGSYWAAKCYFGLSCVAVMRGERTDAARCLLEAFARDPSQARELATDFFNEIMLAYCDDIIKTKEADLARLPGYNARRSSLYSQAIWSQVKWGAAGGAVSLASMFFGSGRPTQGTSLYGRGQNEALWLRREAESLPTEQSILEAANQSLDTRCREIAASLLQHGVYPPPESRPVS
jgi:hypothetical protein